ncbi:NUDIX hydrolase [Leeia aquatica]|uniref:NUDIX hydrolase n=1 Tax=Leeia aquatica TaxID=2725557 RepID=A0A847S487_9NEIS|nr:NUDIX domain-containing protein [Leeia aquatica]NLR74574.1 NUDIX hydrolase [Leeia aquatica]
MPRIPSAEEADFLRRYSIHDFDVPLTTVDLVIFTLRQERLQVLLVRRSDHPYKGEWALPGGFIDVRQDVDLEATARRKLQEKTGVVTPYLEQLQAFGGPQRDPRGWSVTLAYYALLSADSLQHTNTEGADDSDWLDLEGEGVPYELAFDHAQILRCAVQRLRSKVAYSSLLVHLVPVEFTLSELQRVHEQVLNRSIDKSAFRKRIRDGDFLEEVPGKMRHGSNRPAQLYRLRPELGTHYYPRLLGGREPNPVA